MTRSRRDFLKQTGTALLTTLGTAVVPSHGLEGMGYESQDRGEQLTLVQNGQSTYGIVVLPEAAQAARHGALEIQTHVKAMSGATLPILQYADVTAGRLPADVSPAHLITIGASRANSPLQEEEFTIQTVGATLAIAGGGLRGALYGCYALLDEVLGVRWLTSSVTRIPSRPTIILPTLDIHDRPAFSYRDPYWSEAFQRDWAARNRCNGPRANLDASVGGRTIYGNSVHSFFTLVPPAKYFATHPEYFSRVNGHWVADKGLCLTNPDVVAIVVDELLRLIPLQPNAAIWSVSQNDIPDSYCQCDRCESIAQEEESEAGPLLRFVNAIAQKIEPTYPHVLIETLAYQWSTTPPRKTKPRPNVRVRFVTSDSCLSHGLDQCQRNTTVYQHLDGWTKLTNQLSVWHYCVNFIHLLQPLPDFDEIGHDIPLLHRMNVRGIFWEGDYIADGGAFAELKSYLIAKLMWNPARDPRALTTEFLNGVYAQGAPFIQQWIDKQQLEVSRTADHDIRHATYIDPPTVPYLPDTLLADGTELFDAAERATENSAVALAAVQKTRLSLEYVQLLRSAPGTAERDRLETIVTEKLHHYKIKFIGDGRPSSTLQQILQSQRSR